MAANSGLREAVTERAAELGVRCGSRPRELCTDNAAMIAAAARFTGRARTRTTSALDARGAGSRLTGHVLRQGRLPPVRRGDGEARVVRASEPFELEEVDVSLDPALNREYGERIPVVAVEGGGCSSSTSTPIGALGAR